MADEEDVEEEQVEVVESGVGGAEETPTTEMAVALAPPKYEVLPGLEERFKSEQIRELINSCLSEQLLGRTYRADQAPRQAKFIANSVRVRAERICMNRYKILVSVSIAEMKGAGLTCALRCLWDPDSDNYVYDIFQNNTMYAHCTVFGVYLY